MDRGLSFRDPRGSIFVDQVYIAALVEYHIVLPLNNLKTGAEPSEADECGALKHTGLIWIKMIMT